MIEVELKFKLNEDPNRGSCLTEGFRRRFRQADRYYDTTDGLFISKGNFMRIRNGDRIDFKLFAGDDTHLFCEEIKFDPVVFNNDDFKVCEVIKRLGFPLDKMFKNIDEFISVYDLHCIAPIEKERSEYVIEDKIVSFDIVNDLGSFLEVESRFDEKVFDKESAKADLTSFLKKYNLIKKSDEEMKVGYVELYLMKFDRDLYYKGIYLK